MLLHDKALCLKEISKQKVHLFLAFNLVRKVLSIEKYQV